MSRELMSRLLVLETAAGECMHSESAIDERRALAAMFENGAKILNGIAATLRTEASEMAGSRHSYNEALEAFIDAAEDLEVERDAALEVVNRRMEALATIVTPETQPSAPIQVPSFELPHEVLARMTGTSTVVAPTSVATASDASVDPVAAQVERPPRQVRTDKANPPQTLEASADTIAVVADTTANEPSSTTEETTDLERSPAPSAETTLEIETVPEPEQEVTSASEPAGDAGTHEGAATEVFENPSTDLFEVQAGSSSGSDDVETTDASIDAESSGTASADPITVEERASEPTEAVEIAPEILAASEPSTEPADADRTEDGSREPETVQASATPVGARRPGRMPPFVKR